MRRWSLVFPINKELSEYLLIVWAQLLWVRSSAWIYKASGGKEFQEHQGAESSRQWRAPCGGDGGIPENLWDLVNGTSPSRGKARGPACALLCGALLTKQWRWTPQSTGLAGHSIRREKQTLTQSWRNFTSLWPQFWLILWCWKYLIIQWLNFPINKAYTSILTIAHRFFTDFSQICSQNFHRLKKNDEKKKKKEEWWHKTMKGN